MRLSAEEVKVGEVLASPETTLDDAGAQTPNANAERVLDVDEGERSPRPDRLSREPFGDQT